MVRKIVNFGTPVLRAKCRRVETVDEEIRTLATDMIDTMRDAQGIGLAAPQVAVDIQLAVVDVSHDPSCVSYLRIDGKDQSLNDWMPLIFLNPEIEPTAPKVSDIEGCLSFPDIRAEILRPESVRAKLQTLDGQSIVVETDGMLARAIQHETDHLNGILFIDRMSSVAKIRLRTAIRSIKAETLSHKR